MTLDIDELFQELKRRCKPENVYSVREIASSMGINYDYIEQCAADDENLNEILQMCRGHCECNAITAGLKGKLPIQEVHKYWCENDDEFAREHGHEQDFSEYL